MGLTCDTVKGVEMLKAGSPSREGAHYVEDDMKRKIPEGGEQEERNREWVIYCQCKPTWSTSKFYVGVLM